MAVDKARNIKNMNEESIKARLNKGKEQIKKFIDDINDVHIHLQKGNTKTGSDCWTVSLFPIIDCKNCSGCKGLCYDLRNDLRYPNVITDRARNSAVHKMDIKRYWNEIENEIIKKSVKQLRINVGGDLSYDDFTYISEMAYRRPNTDFLFFTKNDTDINQWINDHGNFAKNVHPIMSAWEGMDLNNIHNLPMSHVLYADGRTTAPEFGAYYCGGNCSYCHMNREGCWALKCGEHVIFRAH